MDIVDECMPAYKDMSRKQAKGEGKHCAKRHSRERKDQGFLVVADGHEQVRGKGGKGKQCMKGNDAKSNSKDPTQCNACSCRMQPDEYGNILVYADGGRDRPLAASSNSCDQAPDPNSCEPFVASTSVRRRFVKTDQLGDDVIGVEFQASRLQDAKTVFWTLPWIKSQNALRRLGWCFGHGHGSKLECV